MQPGLGNVFTCFVDAVEMPGKEKVIYCKLPKGMDLIISTPGYMTFEEGKECTFSLTPDAAHFFDSATWKRINW
jgi:multiple sugar transport system ATP-binding protein